MTTSTLGADPELFLINSDGKFISSVGKFGGSKKFPKAIGKSCHVQEDNVALEFNIPPAHSKQAFLESIDFSLRELTVRATKLKLHLSVVPSAQFDKDQLDTLEAQTFGCEPDINAWTLRQNPRPHCKDKSLRSAGGHVHIGNLNYSAHEMARAMDLFLGVPSITLDKDLFRRNLYGKAGAYRQKEYGVEYRTLSNFWLISKNTMEWVYDQTHRALEFLELGNRLFQEDGIEIQECINTSNFDLMKGLSRRYGLVTNI